MSERKDLPFSSWAPTFWKYAKSFGLALFWINVATTLLAYVTERPQDARDGTGGALGAAIAYGLASFMAWFYKAWDELEDSE